MSVPVKPTSSQYKLDVKRPSLLTLIVLISFGSIGAALFTPAIPAIIDFFNVSVSFAQFTVTIYLIGYSIGQLFYSPLAKRFGRKPALYMGISIAVMGTVLCVLARPFYSFNLLLIGRFVMSLGASVGLSLTFLIISDYFYEKHARKITAYTMLAFAVVPGVSIAVGGVLVSFFKWDSCFYFLILYAAFALYLVYRLDETGPGREKSATKIKAVIKNYRRDFKNPILLTYSIIIGSTTAIVYGFAATAPVIVIREMGVRPDMFGFFNLIPASGYFLGNFLAARLATYFEIKTVLRLGIGLMGIGTVVLFSLFWMGIFGLLALFLPVFVIYFGIPLLYSNAAVLATFRVQDKPNASSIMSFINIALAVIGVLVIGVVPGNNTLVMITTFLVIFLFIASLYLFSLKRLNEDEA